MRPVVADASLLDVDDLVREQDRCHPVGDDEDRGAGAGLAQPREDRLLDGWVHRRRGVIEDEQLRVADHRSGQGDPLALTAGEAGASLSDAGVEPLCQTADEGRSLGDLEGAPHRAVIVVGAERDVAPDGVVEHEGLLRDEGRDLGDAAASHLTEVDVVDEHGT